MTQTVDLTNADALKYMTGLDSADLVKEAVISESMMSATAYSMVLVRVKDAKDAQTVAQQMKDGINPRKWICVGADDMVVAGYCDVVMLIMMDSVFAENGLTAQSIADAFTRECGAELDFTLD